jgi:hypothetical protein
VRASERIEQAHRRHLGRDRPPGGRRQAAHAGLDRTLSGS